MAEGSCALVNLVPRPQLGGVFRILPFAAALVATSIPVVCLATPPFLRSPAIVHDTQLYPIAVAVGDFNFGRSSGRGGRAHCVTTCKARSPSITRTATARIVSFERRRAQACRESPRPGRRGPETGRQARSVVAKGGSVSVFLGTSPGRFGPRADYTVSSLVSGVVAADFDGDGIDDVAAADPEFRQRAAVPQSRIRTAHRRGFVPDGRSADIDRGRRSE